jgi:predicted dehydrogenase
MTPPIRVGIVGLSASGGWAADAHVGALAAVDGFELRALSATSAASAQAAADKFSVPLAFGSVQELVASEEVDLVVVAVKVADHRAPVMAALDAGKAVLCEWPLATGLHEATELAELAVASDVRTAVGLQGRSTPVVQYVRDLVADGYVGEVLSTSVVASAAAWGDVFPTRNAYTLDREAGNTMLGVAVGQLADPLTYVLGEVRDVTATTANRRPRVRNAETGEIVAKTSEDQIAVTGVLDSGAVASLHFRGGLSRGTNLLWEINGTDGDLVITGDLGYVSVGRVTLQGARGDENALSELLVPERFELVPRLSGQAGSPAYNVAHAYQRLLEDITTGTEHVPTFATALDVHRLLDRIDRAGAPRRLEASPEGAA